MCFDLLYKFVWNTFYSEKNWARCDKNAYWSRVKYPVFLSDFN